MFKPATIMSQSGLEMKFVPNSFHLSGFVHAITFSVILHIVTANAVPIGSAVGELQLQTFVRNDPGVKSKRRLLARLQKELKREFEQSVACAWLPQQRSKDVRLATALRIAPRAAMQMRHEMRIPQKQFDSTLGYPGEGPPKASVQERIRKAELSLLADVAFGRKSFAQVNKDAQTFSYRGTELESLVFFQCLARYHQETCRCHRNVV